jgi:hypothetical protein
MVLLSAGILTPARPAGAVTWAGYVGPDNGILGTGGVKGANALCNATYAGSRAMTYDDWMALGSTYPDSFNTWLIDGSYTSPAGRQHSKDGATTDTSTPLAPMCQGWLTSSASFEGPYIVSGSNQISFVSCFSSLYIGCVTN